MCRTAEYRLDAFGTRLGYAHKKAASSGAALRVKVG